MRLYASRIIRRLRKRIRLSSAPLAILSAITFIIVRTVTRGPADISCMTAHANICA